MIAQRLLRILEDVTGVTGSFVISPRGKLLLHAMPARFAQPELELTANGVAELLRVSAAAGVAVTDGLLDFGDGKLLVRRFLRGYLCVLCSSRVNMPSLRLTTRLVARGLPSEL